MGRFAAGWLALGSLFIFLSARMAAQTSADITLQIFAKPEGRQFHLLIRVPFQALNGVSIPSSASGQLDLLRTATMLPSVARWWIVDNVDMYEGHTLLSKPQVVVARVSLPSDNAFGTYDLALAHVVGPQLPAETQLFRDQAMLDVLLDYNLPAPGNDVSIHSRLANLASHVTTELQFLAPEGSVRRFEYSGDPGRFYLNPSLNQTSRRSFVSGVWGVLGGSDSWLFLFCIALQLTGIRALGSFFAAFAGVSSLSLLASAYDPAFDALWFPVFIETLIALSILYVAFENMAGGQLVRRKWVLAVVFGAIFGFGYALTFEQTRQFAGSHPLVSAVSFDLGIQLGVLMAVMILATAVALLFRFASDGRVSRRTETVVLSILAADLAWHRFTDRAERLSQFRFHWPTFDAALLAQGLRWLTTALVVGGIVCVVVVLRKYWAARSSASATSSPAKRRPDPV